MKRIEAGRQFPMIKQLPWQLAVNRGAVGESRTSGRRGKTPWGKPVSAINTVRKSQAVSRWGPWKFRPSTAYGAFQPHTRAQTRVPGQWVGYSCAVPGCLNSVGQMSPGRTQLLLLLTYSLSTKIKKTIAGIFLRHSTCLKTDRTSAPADGFCSPNFKAVNLNNPLIKSSTREKMSLHAKGFGSCCMYLTKVTIKQTTVVSLLLSQ